MSPDIDWRPLVFLLCFMLYSSPAIKLWFEMAACPKRWGKWAFGILAVLHTLATIVCALGFFGTSLWGW